MSSSAAHSPRVDSGRWTAAGDVIVLVWIKKGNKNKIKREAVHPLLSVHTL